MGKLSNLRRIRALVREDMNAHVGDIAVLKLDTASMRPLPQHREAMDRLRGYAPEVDLGALGQLPRELHVEGRGELDGELVLGVAPGLGVVVAAAAGRHLCRLSGGLGRNG